MAKKKEFQGSNEFGVRQPDGTLDDYRLWLDIFDKDELPEPKKKQ